MEKEFEQFQTTPTLTLDPFQEERQSAPPARQEEAQVFDESILTEEERRAVDAFADQIDLTNSSVILQYGVGTQKKMADF